MHPVLLASLALAVGVTATPAVTRLTDACSHTVPRYTRAERAARAVAVAAAVTAATWVGLARLGPGRTAVVVPLLVFGAAAVLVDLRERRLPDRLTTALLATTAVAVGTSCAAAGDLAAAQRAVGGAVLAAAVLLAGKLASSAAVGWGDVKFAPALGAHSAGRDGRSSSPGCWPGGSSFWSPSAPQSRSARSTRAARKRWCRSGRQCCSGPCSPSSPDRSWRRRRHG